MKIRLLVVVLLVVLGGLLALVALQWKLDLGRFGESPQRLTVALGTRWIVGAGRAVVGYVDERDTTAVLELKCAAEELTVELAPGAATEETCGVRVLVIGLIPGSGVESPARVALEVSWPSGPAQPTSSNSAEK
ncbi:MAG: hypothetical protein GY856_12905 [bacterium]|nr:hypothetical protein [bacterium]